MQSAWREHTNGDQVCSEHVQDLIQGGRDVQEEVDVQGGIPQGAKGHVESGRGP